jgi:hypothetical protein
MSTISKDNMVVVQKKFTELEICTTILALEHLIKSCKDDEVVIRNCDKMITKLKSTLCTE